MPGSPPKYLAVPSSEDQAYHPNVHEIGVGGDNLDSTSELIQAETQTKWTYFLLGCIILLPWNALVNGSSFFLSRLAGSPFYPTFSSWLSSIFTWAKLFSLFYCTITLKQSSPSRRTFASIVVIILVIISLCLSTYIRGTPSTFFLFALFNAASLAVSSGYLSTSTLAGAALLGSSFLQTVLSGQAAIAVATSVVQVASSMISLWGPSPKSVSMGIKRTDGRGDQAEEVAARIFFGVSAVFLGVTLIAYTWLTRQPFYKSVARTLELHRQVTDTDELVLLAVNDCRNPQEANSPVYQIFEQNLIFMFSVAYVFAVTLAVFPAITTRVQPVNPAFHPLLFTAVHILVYNIGDLAGRYSCSFPRLLVWSTKRILAMSLLRTLLIPLVLLCNVYRPAMISPASPVINSDILFMTILLTMGYTNGFVSSMAMLAVSSLEHNPGLKGRREDVGVAVTLASSFAMVGLAFGALASFGVQALL